MTSKHVKGVPDLRDPQVTKNSGKELTGNSDLQHCLWYKSPGAKQDTLSSFAFPWEDVNDGELFFLNFCFKQKEFNMHSPQNLSAGNYPVQVFCGSWDIFNLEKLIWRRRLKGMLNMHSAQKPDREFHFQQ